VGYVYKRTRNVDSSKNKQKQLNQNKNDNRFRKKNMKSKNNPIGYLGENLRHVFARAKEVVARITRET
jgi:hypothetical protein